MLEQELHGAFARFPSLSHTNLTMPEVSRLGKRKMKILREKHPSVGISEENPPDWLGWSRSQRG